MENQDFVRFTENSVKPNDGRPSQEYFITLYMAKGLSMVEHNEKGKQARKYFSEVSKLSPRGLRTVSLSTILLKIKTLSCSTKNGANNARLIEYYITLDMAKQFTKDGSSLPCSTLLPFFKEVSYEPTYPNFQF